MTEDQLDVLVCKYRDPIRPGLLNYLNMHHVIQAIQQSNNTDAHLQANNHVGDFLKPEVRV